MYNVTKLIFKFEEQSHIKIKLILYNNEAVLEKKSAFIITYNKKSILLKKFSHMIVKIEWKNNKTAISKM